MKKLVKKISDKLRSDWKEMSIISKCFVIWQILSVIALFVCDQFLPQYFWSMVTVVIINMMINMLSFLGSIFLEIGREIFKDVPAEWKKASWSERIICSIKAAAIGAIIIVSVVVQHLPEAVLTSFTLILILTIVYWTIMLLRKHFSGLRFIESIQTNLQLLKEQLELVDATENKVEALVRLFQVISPLQDAGGFAQVITNLKKYDRKGKYAEQLKALEILQKHFENAGRCEYGINRTVKGEEVTADKVMIGSVRGLNTFSASYWLERKERLMTDWHPDYKNSWEAINGYCRNIVVQHVQGINQQIAVLKIA